jgi:hypothetical protein
VPDELLLDPPDTEPWVVDDVDADDPSFAPAAPVSPFLPVDVPADSFEARLSVR